MGALLELWGKAPWGKGPQGPFKMARRVGSSCSSCHIRFTAAFANRIANPLHVGQCPSCGILVAAGVREVGS
jgi:hypothetical protein